MICKKDGQEVSRRYVERPKDDNFLKLPIKLQSKTAFPIDCIVNVLVYSDNKQASEITYCRIVEVGVDISLKSDRELLFKVLRLSVSQLESRTLFYTREKYLRYAYGSTVWVATSKNKWEKATVLGLEDPPTDMKVPLGEVTLSRDPGYALQISGGKVLRNIRPNQVTHRGQYDTEPEWKDSIHASIDI